MDSERYILSSCLRHLEGLHVGGLTVGLKILQKTLL